MENEGAFRGLNEMTDKATKKAKKAHSITSAMVNKWKKELLEKVSCNHIYIFIFSQKSLKALKKLILAFKVCCYLTEQEGEDEDEEITKAKFQIASSSVFNNVMTFCFKQLPVVFAELLDLNPLSKKYLADCNYANL